MNKIYLRNTLFVLTFLFTLSSAVMNQSGPTSPLTNAPSEGNCTNCHSGSLVTSGTNFDKIFLTTGFQGNGYVPDSTYSIALSFKQSGIARYGFQITCLTSTGSTPVGTFSAGNSRVQKISATVSGNTRQYIEHTTTGSDTVKKDSTRWVFSWKAPSSNVGKIKFYVCLNATNSNGSDNGDIIYAKTFEYSISPLLPAADATSIDSVTCTNYIAQMTGKGTNSPTSYSWKFINGTPATSGVQNPTVKFSSAGTQLAILTVKNALGTSKPDTLKVTVKQSPGASILNGAGGTICKGDSIQISANTGTNITYKWAPNNKTTRSIFVKDTTGSYNVTVTSTLNSCTATSGNYKLGWYPKPVIAISRTLTADTFCDVIKETFTASGTAFDTILWYVNNKLYAKINTTNTLKLPFGSNVNSSIYAVGKSANNCVSANSNTFNLKVTPIIYPVFLSISKTTSTIDIKWKKTAGIDSIVYRVFNFPGNFKHTTTDTTLSLTGLQPSTFYNIWFRSYQKGICQFSDSTLSVRTDNCSNISYNIVMNSKVCKGDPLSVTINNLPKSKVSVSFNNQPYGTDTTYSFTPVASDSLVIKIIDSLSLTCQPIVEKKAYTLDTFPNDNGIYNLNVKSCVNSYTYAINSLYQKYEFFKNNVKLYSGTSNQFNYTGLVTGDQLSAKVFINTCSKTIGTVSFTISKPSDATFTFSRNWKTYTFKPNDTTNVNYAWYINDTLIANSQNLVKDMSAYANKTVVVKLKTVNFPGCTDSSSQSITFPNFSSVPDITNYQLNIFPNPFNEQIEIITNLSDYQLNVYDNLGRNILQLNDLKTNQQINTSGWMNGLYHIVLSNANLKLDRVLIKVQ